MSIGGIFNSGLKGLATAGTATQVAANNVSNAATVGYSRRTVNVDPNQALLGGQTGSRVVEPFIQKRLLTSQSSAGDASASKTSLEVLDTVFAEGDGSLGSAMDAFEVSMQTFSAQPEDASARQMVLARAGDLATAFNTAYEAVDGQRTEVNSRINDGVNQLNDKLDQIGKLGTQIQQAEVNGNEASDLRDQRDQIISDVAKKVPVTVLDQGRGQISLLLAGSQQLVAPDGKVTKLSTAVDDKGDIRLKTTAGGANHDVTDQVNSGELGGLLRTRKTTLTQVTQKLNTLAEGVVNAYNSVHQAGVNLDGETGRALFQFDSTAGAAKSMAVSQDVAGQPNKLAAATQAGLPSDNRNALAMAGLSAKPLTPGGKSPADELAALVGFAGTAVQGASTTESFATSALSQVQALKESATGVSSDEEMITMMKYQKAYQASLKVIQVADEMLGDLLKIR